MGGGALVLSTEYTECQSPLAGRLNWLPPHPKPQASVYPQDPSGGTQLACVKGVGGSISDEGADTIYGTLYTNSFSLVLSKWACLMPTLPTFLTMFWCPLCPPTFLIMFWCPLCPSFLTCFDAHYAHLSSHVLMPTMPTFLIMFWCPLCPPF